MTAPLHHLAAAEAFAALVAITVGLLIWRAFAAQLRTLRRR